MSNSLAMLSFAMLLACCFMWLRSYARLDDVSYTSRWHVHNFSSLQGRLYVQLGWSREDQLLRMAGSKYAGAGFVWDTASSDVTLAVQNMSRGWTLGGFDFFEWKSRQRNAAGQPVSGESDIIIPWWFVTWLAALYPAIWFSRRRRLRLRAASGRCISCGYDLRASSGRCPECGQAAGQR